MLRKKQAESEKGLGKMNEKKEGLKDKKTNIPAHGGKLVNRVAFGKERKDWQKRAVDLEKIHLDSREASDLEMIAVGAFSPLQGFMVREDYESVLENMRLAKGFPWTIPITISVSKEKADKVSLDDYLALLDKDGIPVGILEVKDKYSYDREREALLVYGTKEEKHPGVKYIYQKDEVHLGGPITLLQHSKNPSFQKYYSTPSDTRRLFQQKTWRRIVGFQTRNPVHRAHEYIQKCALETVDGLLLHPLVGETKRDDIPADVRMKCYEVLLENYYAKNRVVLAVLPAAMRYAGPKEAIFHALIRKNYGCTHFIVGRDHAGVGNYYGSFDAHRIFDEFEEEELGIQPMFFDYTFYCKRCIGMVSSKTCPHNSQDHITLSGSQIREMLQKGEMPPLEFTRPEIAQVLMKWATKQTEYWI